MQAPSSQAQYSDEYDDLFRIVTARYLHGLVPDDDWRWLKAQCYQESRLVPDAVSPAGAVGICQLMPGAALDGGLAVKLRTDPERNIQVGGFILRRNIRTWFPRPTRFARLQLGWAGYNAGVGHILRAQALCEGASEWESISPCLHLVTGYHAGETIHYVRVIPAWYGRMIRDY